MGVKMNKKLVWYSLAVLSTLGWLNGITHPETLTTSTNKTDPVGFTIVTFLFIALFIYLGKKAKPGEKFMRSQKSLEKAAARKEQRAAERENKQIIKAIKNTREYTVIDIETTGLSIENDTIIEIAAIRMRYGSPARKFSTFINPHQQLTFKITDITGITDKDLKNAPELNQALTKFIKFIGKDTIIGHNIDRFDIPMINNALARVGMEPMSNDTIDTLPLAQAMYPQLSRHRLLDLIRALGIADTEEHRALSDSYQNALVFEIMKKQLH